MNLEEAKEFPPRNASYWKRRCRKAEADVDMCVEGLKLYTGKQNNLGVTSASQTINSLNGGK